MNFNLGDITNSQSDNKPQLEGNQLHIVTFDGCKSRDFTGVQDPSKTYKVLEIKFSNESGQFTHTIWQPKDEDFQPRQTVYGAQPANVASMAYLFKHLLDAVAPDVAEKINKKELNLDINPNNWNAVRDFMVKNTEAAKGTVTKIKLIKNNKGEAMFPYFLNYSREGKLYMSTNFIGKDVTFTIKELEKIQKAESAKPTSVDLPTTTTDDSDFDDEV